MSLALRANQASLAPAVLVLFALLVLYSLPTFLSLHEFWVSYAYSHGYLVLLVTVVLFWLELRRAPLAPLVPSLYGFACLVPLAMLMLAGHGATVVAASQVALPALWIVSIWAFAGAANARRFAPAVAYLYVAIPVWHVLTEPLRRTTVFVVSAWIRAAELPAYIEGNFIHVPNGTFEVAEGCSGLRYLLVAFALAVLVGLLNRRRFSSVALLTLLALGSVMVGNWLRVFITVAAGFAPEVQPLIFVRDHHFTFGWIMFLLSMVPFFYVNRVLEQRSANLPPADQPVRGSAPGPANGKAVYAMCAVFVIGIVLNVHISRGEERLPGDSLQLPGVANWDRIADWQDESRPDYVGATLSESGWYSDGDGSVGVFGASYAVQRQEQEIVHAHNRPAGQSGVVVGRAPVMVETESGLQLPFEELQVSDPDSTRRLVWVALRIAGQPASGAFTAKALQLFGALAGRRDAQALVLTAVCDADCAASRETLARYARTAAARFFEDAQP